MFISIFIIIIVVIAQITNEGTGSSKGAKEKRAGGYPTKAECRGGRGNE
jgi:hypothetical protein